MTIFSSTNPCHGTWQLITPSDPHPESNFSSLRTPSNKFRRFISLRTSWKDHTLNLKFGGCAAPNLCHRENRSITRWDLLDLWKAKLSALSRLGKKLTLALNRRAEGINGRTVTNRQRSYGGYCRIPAFNKLAFSYSSRAALQKDCVFFGFVRQRNLQSHSLIKVLFLSKQCRSLPRLNESN